jgi:hypothetical protein
MLKVNESKCKCFSAYNLITVLSLLLWLAYYIIPLTY